MNTTTFTYIVAEGILDVLFLENVLVKEYGWQVVKQLGGLPQPARKWFDAFKWPMHGDIARRAVPAPSVLIRGTETVGIRSAQGLKNISNTIEADMEICFKRLPWLPTSLGILLDSDEEPPQQRFMEFAGILLEQGYPAPDTLGTIASNDEARAGIFSFPGDEASGTIEDVVLPLGERRFPGLHEHAGKYVRDWETKIQEDTGADFKELKKTAGAKKAQLSAIAALLKPGKPFAASLQDYDWLGTSPRECHRIGPLMCFLDALIEGTGL